MAEKNIKTRIIHKHDTEANWNKATNFIPKAAEIIVYDPDSSHTHPRIKIGDGVSTVINLAFVSMTEAQLNAILTTQLATRAVSSNGDGVADSALKLKASKTIDGVSFDGSSNVTHFGKCSTSASTTAKTVSVAGFTLSTGARVLIQIHILYLLQDNQM